MRWDDGVKYCGAGRNCQHPNCDRTHPPVDTAEQEQKS